jgi:hypothetical protein
MGVLDDYMVDPKISLLDKTRIQAQVLVPVMQALRAEIGKEKADALVRRALRDWSKQLFAAVGNESRAARGANGRQCKAPWPISPSGKSRSIFIDMTRKPTNST